MTSKQLNQAVTRNERRFPQAFSFQLTLDEWDAEVNRQGNDIAVIFNELEEMALAGLPEVTGHMGFNAPKQ